MLTVGFFLLMAGCGGGHEALESAQRHRLDEAPAEGSVLEVRPTSTLDAPTDTTAAGSTSRSDREREDAEGSTGMLDGPTGISDHAALVIRGPEEAAAELAAASGSAQGWQARDVVDDPAPPTPEVLAAAGNLASVYFDGCHLDWDAIEPRLCVFGDPASPVTVVVTGDSHAAHWAAGMIAAAEKARWRLVMLTKAGCPAADVPVYSARPEDRGKKIVYTSCAAWRPLAQALIATLDPDLVIYPMLTRRTVIDSPGSAALGAWSDGLERSARLVQAATKTGIVILTDTPKTNGQMIPKCVAEHRSDLEVCSQPRSLAVDPAVVAALEKTGERIGALVVDTSGWFCTTQSCPAVIGGEVVYRDDHHLTNGFSRLRGRELQAVITAALSERTAG